MKKIKQIYVVDDNQDVCEIVSLILTEQNFEVVSIYSIQAFKQLIQNNLPDLVLLDLNIRNENIELLIKKLRSNQKVKNIPIILMSGDSNIEEKSKELNVDDFLKKPFDMNQLVDIVKKYT
mgnify:CR=1 FL=1